MSDTTLTDPLGRTVVLHDRTWFGHVVKTHADLADHRIHAENAIRSPDEIRRSRGDPDCRLYFGTRPSAIG
jgi:hypothetical protein